MMPVSEATTVCLPDSPASRAERIRWWKEARFGLFIHWGLYAIPGIGEWVMREQAIKIRDYEKLAVIFNPRPGAARRWARLARAAGMRYMVLTAKHHDGFCLFKTRLTRYNAVQSAAQRDLVAEYVEACRLEGLRVGLYYSVLDWHHPSYPLAPDDPLQLLEPRARTPDVSAYYAYMMGQVRELLTQYGKIDVLWFDGANPVFDGKAAFETIRALQPNILINDRLPPGEPDFVTPEQAIPATPVTRNGRRVAWEACHTMSGNAWGYHRYDRDCRSAADLIRLLTGAAECGGNLLLNVGPRPDGGLRPVDARRLREVGQWMKVNGASIQDTDAPRCRTAQERVARPRVRKTSRMPLDYAVPLLPPVRVDGSVDPDLWRTVPRERVTPATHYDGCVERYPFSSREGYGAYSFRIMHTGAALYLAIEVETPTRIVASDPRRGDCVRVFLAANTELTRCTHDPESFEITVDIGGNVWMPNENARPCNVFRHGVRHTAEGYNVVLAVPFTMMRKRKDDPASVLRAGDRLRMNLLVQQPSPPYRGRRQGRGTAWWERADGWKSPPAPGPRHMVFWKGKHADEDPFNNVAVWGMLQLSGRDAFPGHLPSTAGRGTQV